MLSRRQELSWQKCPLLAQSGHAETSAILSAFGGKADISEPLPDNRIYEDTPQNARRLRGAAGKD